MSKTRIFVAGAIFGAWLLWLYCNTPHQPKPRKGRTAGGKILKLDTDTWEAVG